MAGIPLSAFENYTPATDERESFKQYFEQKTANLDSVGKQKALDQIHDYIKSQHGEEQAKYWTEAVKIQKPERTWGQAVSDGLNYLGVMVDSAEQPFADFYDPSSDWATNNRLEKAAHLADLSESQRFDDYKAERNMALAAKQGELAKAGAWLENFIDSPMRQGSELAGSLLPHAALTGVTIASGGTLAPYTVPAMMSVGAAQGIGGARGDLYQATHAMSDADLQAHNEEYRALRQSGISEQVAKDMVGTNIAEHLPELALSGATGAITERFGVVNMLRGKGGALRNIGAEIASEALDEAAQTVLSNSMKQAVNPNQTLYEDVLTNALAGGLMGGVGGVITAPFTQSSQQDANTNSVDSIMEQARNTTTTQLTQSLPTPEYIAIQSALRDGLQNLASKNAMGMESHNQWKRRLETIDEQRETFEQRFQKDYQDGNLNTILNTVDNKKTSEEDKQYHAFVRSVMSKFTPDFEANRLENMDEKVRQQYEQQIQQQAQAEQNRLQSIANLPETQQGQTPSTHAAPATTSQELMDMLIKAGVNPPNGDTTAEQSATEPSALQRAAQATTHTGKVVKGKTSSVDVSGNYQPTQWQIREASDLGASIDKADNQYRDRTRAASQQQINKIASNLDYRKLGDSPVMDYGAPTLAKDGQTIIGGNGRVAGIKQAYADGNAENYRQSLINDASQYGFTPEQIQSFSQPVLVRTFQNEVDIQQAAIASNESGGLAMSALEQAKADATRLPPLSNFTFNESGSLNNGANRNAISQWVDKFPQSQQAALQDADGRLSQQGLARLQNAMLYQAYGDTPTLARMIESTSNESRNISNALAQAAGGVADAKDTLQQYGTLNDLDISNDLTAAAELIEQLRADGLSVADWLAQQELIPDIAATPSARALVEYFDTNIRSAKAIRELINEYYRLATDYNPNQEDMFGDTIAPSKEQLLQQALNQHGQTTNFNTSNQPAISRTEPKQQESSTNSPDLQPTNQPRNGETDATSTRQPSQATAQSTEINNTPQTTNSRPKTRDTAEEIKNFFDGFKRDVINGYRKEVKELGTDAFDSKINQLEQHFQNNEQEQADKLVDELRQEISKYGKANGFKLERLGGLGNFQWIKDPSAQPTNTQTDGLSDEQAQPKDAKTDNTKSSNTRFSRSQAQTSTTNQNNKQAYQTAINQALGKHAHAVKVVSRDELVRPENAENLDGVEGFYNPADGSITLIAESLKDAQHAQFVAWHELAHRKIDVSGAADWNNEIEKAGRHETVRKLADKIQAQRKNTDDPAATNRAIANEEAIAELYAAHETGDYKALEQKYGIKIPRVLQRNLGGFLSRLGNKLASIWRKITGKRETNSADVYRLLQTLSRANDTNKRATRSGSLKRSSNADRATYDRAFENGETELTFTQWQQVRTPEFKAWFGDWENDPENASKVINQKTGEPLVVYHGTKSDDGFSVFWTHEYGAPIGAFFTSNINVARTYAEQKEINALYKKYPERFAEKIKELEAYNDAHIYSVFLNIRNPYSLDAKGKNYTQLGEDGNKYTDQFIPLKYKTNDGIIFKNIYDIGAKRNQLGSSNGLSDVFIAFEPNQIKSATNNVGAFDPSNDDIRYSRRTTQADIAQIAKTGKIDYDKSLFQSIMDNDIGSYINQNRNAHRNIADWLIEGFADNLHPVAKWIDKLPIKEQQRELLKQAMYRAGGKRDYANEQITRQYIQPLNQELARVAKKYGRSAIEVKRLVGYWLSAKYAPTANARLLKRAADELAAAQQSNDAQAIAQAQQAYDERKAAIDGVAQGKVAGGYSNPFAAQVKADLEQHISPADMQAVGQHIYAMLQHKLDLDLNSGRISQQMYQEFKANPDYIPLTGDPMSELQDDNDIISHGGGMNQSRDKQMQGATSIAEDGIDAAMKAVSKTTAIHGWSDFKSQLNKVYESAIADQKAQGKTPQQAEQYVIQQYGMTRRALQGVTRPSDNRIIYQSNGQYYEFELNNELVEALQRHNTEKTNSFLNLIAIPNRWAARAVTQFTPSFAPVNAIRDMWEKSEMIRTFKAWDSQGKAVDMDKVANSALAKFITGKGIKQTFNMAWRNDFSTPQGQELKRFLELGGVSTQGVMLAPTESDLIKQIKKETGFGKVLNQALHVVENYNKTLDLMPSFAMYQALREQGVSDVEAAGLVLDTTNFRKTGKYMNGIKAIYMFAQPIATGAYNLARFLNTKKGKQRAMLYFAAGVALYSILREVDDEDESGNKMDAMGDITRFIPIPLPNGKYLKIPVGFGLPQMMWNMATNSVKAFHGDITPTEALSNMASHWTKTIAPVSPSEIPVSQYPAAKAALTLTPSFLQPMVQQALNRNAFGTQITLGYTSSKKLKAEQSKATTAKEWQDLALFMQRKTSVDMHPEQWKNLIMGYGSMLFGGLFRDAINMTIENPNAEELGKTGKTPFINALYGAGNEFAIQSRYYEAYDEARSISQEYESRKREGDLGDWLTEERKKKLDWFRRATSSEQRVSKRKSRATRAHNKGAMSDERYRQAELNAVSQRLEYQKPLLKQWRRMENLNTID